MKKTVTGIAAIVMALVTAAGTRVYGAEDNYILSGPVSATYSGTPEAAQIIFAAQFTDTPAGFWARTAVIQDAALDLVTGYAGQFYPNRALTNEEALTFIIKVIGREADAAPAVGVTPLASAWSAGFMQAAVRLGIIPAGYAGGTAPARREDVADWLTRAILSVDAGAFPIAGSAQKVFAFRDYNAVSADKMNGIELVTANGIMNGYPDNTFRPAGTMTRAEMAQALYNLGDIYFRLATLEKKTGVVSAAQDYNLPGGVRRDLYVRVSDGTADILSHSSAGLDAVTLKNGALSGMSALKEGDAVEYIVRAADNAVLYVQSGGAAQKTVVMGTLTAVDTALLTVEIAGADGSRRVYSYARGMIADARKLPYGSGVSLTLTGGVAVELNYAGEPVLAPEIRGIVVENNADYGYITIIDNYGNKITKHYYENDLTVKKQEYYETGGAGYITEMFPHFRYDPRDTVISNIEPGDIVFIKTESGGGDVIASISAASNYSARYGKAVSLKALPEENAAEMLVEYENGQTAWFTVAGGIFVTKDGRPASLDRIITGDWVRLLINQAVIAPGQAEETVKEIVVESAGHLISGVVKGSFAGIDAVQKRLLLENAYTLAKTGWANYKNAASYALNGNDFEFYYNGQRISPDYALKYFKRGEATVYVALEGNFAGERVRKVTFRTGWEEDLGTDTVAGANGAGAFDILSLAGSIQTDPGTIVLRYGRLVDGKDIMPADYARVALNGQNSAAVVDIGGAPGNAELVIARGRIYSVDEGKSFKVSSMSVLSGYDWIYTPVAREFTIDHNTIFLDEKGYVDPVGFIGYSDKNALNKVYYIVIDGARAAYVIDAPYAVQSVRGTVYKVESQAVYIKDAMYYETASGRSVPVSNQNATLVINTAPNTIIAKNGALVPAAKLQAGDGIRVMCAALPARITGGVAVDANIIFVER